MSFLFQKEVSFVNVHILPLNSFLVFKIFDAKLLYVNLFKLDIDISRAINMRNWNLISPNYLNSDVLLDNSVKCFPLFFFREKFLVKNILNFNTHLIIRFWEKHHPIVK